MISMSLIAFSVFNIVKFANDACEGSDSKVQKMTHIKKFFFNFHIKLFKLRMELVIRKTSVKIKVEKQVEHVRKVISNFQ